MILLNQLNDRIEPLPSITDQLSFIDDNSEKMVSDLEFTQEFIDKYLDDCFMAKLSPVRIVHGKGTGALRNGIHKYLKTNKYVDSYRMGTFGEGEMGVTIVTLKIK